MKPNEIDSFMPWQQRNAAAAAAPTSAPDGDDQNRDLNMCMMQIRAATLNEAARTVEATLSTENPVQVYDWHRGGVIDEILTVDGANLPDQMPFLENHYRWSLDYVLGSIRNMRAEQGTVNRIGCTLHFEQGDAKTDRAFRLVKNGHVRDISVGYRVIDWKDIPPNTTEVVNGRSYTAGERWLRVATKWKAREGSLTPIGADEAAKIRSSQRQERKMNEQLRNYLQSLGLRADASETEAWAYMAQLSNAEHRARAEQLRSPAAPANPANDPGRQAPSNPQTPAGGAPNDPQRQATGNPGTSASPAASSAAAAPAANERTGPQELERVRQINELAGQHCPAELLQRALYGNQAQNQLPMSVDQFSRALLEHERSQRSEPVGQRAPAAVGLNRGSNTEQARAISASLVLRARGYQAIHLPNVHDADQRRKEQERIANMSDRYRGMPLTEICREALRIEGRDASGMGWDEMIRSAMSTATLSYIFTDSVHAAVVADFAEFPDTTRGWVQEGENANFKKHTDITRGKNKNTMQKLPRGGTAEQITFSDEGEEYKVARYAEMLLIDEQDIIDDSFDLLTEAPGEMAADAARLRPDMVYALLLKNPTLKADGKAVFHTDHGNLDTATLNAAGLRARSMAMSKQTRDGRQLNITPTHLIVGPDLMWTGKELISSSQIILAGNTDVERGNRNVLQDLNLQLISEGRLGVAGVTDPVSETHYAGSATNWFLAGRERTIKVIYRTGTGRRPVVRPFTLDKGQYGIGWDISLDIGAFVRDFRALDKGNA